MNIWGNKEPSKNSFSYATIYFSTTFSQCSRQPKGDCRYDEYFSTNLHLLAKQYHPVPQEAAAWGDFCPSWSPEANTCTSCWVKACSIFLSVRLFQTSNSCFPVCCWEEDSPGSSQSYLWMCWQWITLLLADALEILKTASTTSALTHFRDPPSDVSQLQKVRLHLLDSLSSKHSKGISPLLPPPPALLTHFVASECL